MEFVAQKGKVYTELPTKQFGIQVNEKTFSILTSGIYQNKIRALIREYSTNAVDAQIENNYSGKFDVTLPTSSDLRLTIRDYGVGLSKEDFDTIFTNFFASTKDKTNAYNGTLGLGSKCFASYYTKTCTIESWKNGRHYIFSCFIGNSGLPEATILLDEVDTKSHSGTKIIIPVNKDDIDVFREEAESVYFAFDPKYRPNINKHFQYEKKIPDSLKTFKSKHGEIASITSNRHNILFKNKVCAVMSNVFYPIDFFQDLEEYKTLFQTDEKSTYSYNYDNTTPRLFLFFNNGEINFTPSRETLEYNPRTIAAIKNKLKDFMADYEKYISNIVNSSTTELDAVKKVYSLTSIGNFMPLKHIVFKNKKIPIIKSFDSVTKKVTAFYNGKVTFYPTVPLFAETNNRNSYDRYRVYYNDLDKENIARLREKSKRDRYIKYYLLDDDILAECPLQYKPEDFTLKLSSLNAVQKVATTPRLKLSNIMKLKNGRTLQDSWESEKIADVTHKVYVVRSGLYCKGLFGGQAEIELSPKDVLVKFSPIINNKPIYGVYQREVKKLRELSFISFDEFLKNEKESLIEFYKKNSAEIDYYYTLSTTNIYSRSNLDMLQSIINIMQNINVSYSYNKPKTDFKKFELLLNDFKNILDMKKSVKHILADKVKQLDFFNIPMKIVKDRSVSVDEHDCIFKTFYGLTDESKQIITNYFLGYLYKG